jgi:nitrite reductase/ring-hydroxylating ferredoxin subunit
MRMADSEGVSNSLSPLSAIPEGGFIAVDANIAGESESIILHRDAAGVRAWLNICPHAGRRLDLSPGRFLMDKGRLMCPMHGALFRTTDGECVAGPCRGAHLKAVAIEVVDEDVVLAEATKGAPRAPVGLPPRRIGARSAPYSDEDIITSTDSTVMSQYIAVSGRPVRHRSRGR